MAAAREPMNVTFHGSPTAATAQLHSPWHSPVPYLFGGLAAMLGLIAFALLILACSYWKLSGYLDGGEGEGDRDLEAGEDDNLKPQAPLEEKILVIMAGQAKPTYLATPMSSRSSSFGDTNSSSSSSSGGCSNCGAGRNEKMAEMTEMEKQVVQSQSRIVETTASVQQQTDEDEDHQTQTH